MSTGTVKLPHASVTGAENWLRHDAGPALAHAGLWLMTAVKDTITAIANHQIPDPVQSLASILLFVAIIGVAVSRAKSRRAKGSS